MFFPFVAIGIFVVVAILLRNRRMVDGPSAAEPGAWVCRIPLLPFVLLAAIGFVLSFAAHVLSLFGVRLPGGSLVWSLHVGIFVIWIPAVALQQQEKKTSKDSLAESPPWIRIPLTILFVYALLNFAYFAITAPPRGSRKAESGEPAPPRVVRGFSGHWMLFYGAGFAMTWSSWSERRRAASVPPIHISRSVLKI